MINVFNPQQLLHYIIHIHNSEGINYLSKIDNWKRFEKNSSTVALNIFYIKEKEILPAYIFQNITQPMKNK